MYLTPELQSLLEAQRARVKALQRKAKAVVPYVFPRLSGRKRGARVKDFRKAWDTARTKAGCPGMLRHDFRRTAVRNLERANVPRSVAMKITEHRTEAVYRRYAIVSDADLRDAVGRLARADAQR